MRSAIRVSVAKRVAGALLPLAFVALGGGVRAQTIPVESQEISGGGKERSLFGADCDKVKKAVVRKDTKINVTCDKVLVLSWTAAEAQAGLDEIQKQLLAANEALVQNLKLQTARLEEMERQHQSIEATMDQTYRQLEAKTDELAQLTDRSSRLTEQAVKVSKAQRFASYVTAILVGGTAGGLVAGKASNPESALSFNWPGAVVGATGGLALTIAVSGLFTGSWPWE